MIAATALACLATNIYYEAATESRAGKIAVAQVTMNRAGGYPTRVCSVVYEKRTNPVTGKKVAAFSWTLGRAWRAPGPIDQRIYAECVGIAVDMLAGTLHSDEIGTDVLSYHATYVHPEWHKLLVATIGHHVFYRN